MLHRLHCVAGPALQTLLLSMLQVQLTYMACKHALPTLPTLAQLKSTPAAYSRPALR